MSYVHSLDLIYILFDSRIHSIIFFIRLLQIRYQAPHTADTVNIYQIIERETSISWWAAIKRPLPEIGVSFRPGDRERREIWNVRQTRIDCRNQVWENESIVVDADQLLAVEEVGHKPLSGYSR